MLLVENGLRAEAEYARRAVAKAPRPPRKLFGTVEVALGTREGSSVRGGGLGGLHDGALADAGTVDKVIDAAVAAVGARQGVAVSLPSAAGGGGGVVDSAALGEFAEQVTGPNGVLASAARLILGQLGLDTPVSAPEATDEVLGASDFVLLLLPATRDTENFMDARRLCSMRPS